MTYLTSLANLFLFQAAWYVWNGKIQPKLAKIRKIAFLRTKMT